MTMTLPAGSIDEARNFYAEAGLAFPPIPAAFEAAVVRQDEAVWGTRAADEPLYAIEAWASKAVDGEDFLLFGMDGHGINSWATHLYVAEGPAAVLMQVAAGGAMMEPAETANRVEGAWDLVKGLFEIVAEAGRQGKLPKGRRLVVVDTDFGRSRWAWVDPNSNDEPAWQTSIVSPSLSATADLAQRMQGP